MTPADLKMEENKRRVLEELENDLKPGGIYDRGFLLLNAFLDVFLRTDRRSAVTTSKHPSLDKAMYDMLQNAIIARLNRY